MIFSGSRHHNVFAICALLSTFFASSASILNITVISKRRSSWSAYLALITCMAAFQLLYDLSFFPGVVNMGNKYLTIAANLVQIFSGTVSAIMSNLVAYVAFYVIYHKKVFDINQNFFFMIFFVVLIASLFCIFYIISVNSS
jgi:hypothetical protein